MSETFDPDAYLAEKQAAFDPDEYLQTKKTQAGPPQVGAGETFLNRATDAIPLGKPAVDIASTGVLQAAKHLFGTGDPGVHLTPEAKAALAKMGQAVDESSAIPDAVDMYRKARDERAARTALGTDQHPDAAKLGTAAGIGLSMLAPLPKVTVGTGTAGRVASGALTGAAYGGTFGLTHGSSDLTRGEIARAFKDAVGVDGIRQSLELYKGGKYLPAALSLAGSGALGGALLGGGVAGTVEGARPWAAPALKDVAIKQGRRVLTNGADSLSTRAPVSADAVDEALNSGAIRAGGTTEGALKRLQALADEQGNRYGDIVDQLESNGVRGPPAKAIDAVLEDRSLQKYGNSLNPAEEHAYDAVIDKLRHITGPDGNLGLRQSENLKRSLQDLARYGRVEETPLNHVRRDMASIFRNANEEAVDSAGHAAGEGSKVRALADQFKPVKQRLGRLLEAEEAAQRGTARVAQRQSGNMPSSLETMAAVGTGNPGVLIAKPVLNLAKTRGTSTVAAGAHRIGKALESGTASEAAAAKAAPALDPALERAPGFNAVLVALRSSPHALGKYAPFLQSAMERGGPELAAAYHEALLRSDPDYTKQLSAALNGAR